MGSIFRHFVDPSCLSFFRVADLFFFLNSRAAPEGLTAAFAARTSCCGITKNKRNHSVERDSKDRLAQCLWSQLALRLTPQLASFNHR